MAQIKVNHKKLGQLGSDINSYQRELKKEYRIMNDYVINMRPWVGIDEMKFEAKWQGIISGGSVSGALIDSLGNYGDMLITVSNKYKMAQMNAVNKANRLK